MADPVASSQLQPQRPFFVLGLTGSIGMGKSTVSEFFREQGVPVLDADQVVHDLYAKGGAAVGPVANAFPASLVDGAIDRKALGTCVVGNDGAMKQLEGIVHPLVSQERSSFLQKVASEGHPLVVLDVPLLYETGLEAAVDAVAVVSAPEHVQRQRVLSRPGMTDERFAAILSRQVPDKTKRERADFVLDTSLTLEETRAHVAALIAALKGRRGAAAGRL